MAGFETIVRPAVLPNIRPSPTQSLTPEADPTKGFAVISGNGGKEVSISLSWSASSSKSHAVESQRRVDTVRIYQQDDAGDINHKNFVDVNVVNKLWTTEGAAPSTSGRGFDYDQRMQFWQKALETDNIKILQRNLILTNPDAIERS